MAMATPLKITARCFIFSNLPSSFSLLKHHHSFSTFPSHFRHPSPFTRTPISLKPPKPSIPKLLFTTNINTKSSSPPPSSSDSDYTDSDEGEETQKKTALATKNFDKTKLPPPYDPFNKKPVIEEPEDPTNLQEIFHDMSKGDGLYSFAVKMFDGLSKDGLTHEALQLFSQIKYKGQMPDIVAHTAVIEAYVNAGQAKPALKKYMQMLACGIKPNAYTYAVLIKGLAGSGDKKFMKEAKKLVVEMLGKGMKVNAGTCVAVFEAFVKMGNVDEGKEFLEEMKGKGFEVNEEEVREVLKGRRGPEVRSVMEILFGK